MSVSNFREARNHVGHKIECVMYGKQNVSVECIECNEVMISYEKKEQKINNNRKQK